jgi:excisionase family DNA binding protein
MNSDVNQGRGQKMDRLLISVEDAAELLGVGRSTVYDLMRSGSVPSVRIGRCRRIPLDGLRSYLADLESQTWIDDGRPMHLRRGA